MYKTLVKPILFKQDPEKVHDRTIKLASFISKFWILRILLASVFRYNHQILTQQVDQVKYQNPIGLAAGFDKNAQLMKILPSMGFGFEEVGSVTALACQGNPKPRLWRLPNYKSLVVHYGLKNDGARKIKTRLKNKKFAFPIGISIAKTNCKETADIQVGIQDYVTSFTVLEPYASYITLNISCPNAYGGQPFTSKEELTKLCKEIRQVPSTKPIYIKISPDLTRKEIDNIIQVTRKFKLQGFIIANLTKNREQNLVSQKDLLKVGKGGLSGKVVESKANEMISYVYKKTRGECTIIGCGGIFSAKDAYEKIKRGASLVQLITGMVYEGPSIVSRINKGLVKLLRRDGFENISQAVGSYYR